MVVQGGADPGMLLIRTAPGCGFAKCAPSGQTQAHGHTVRQGEGSFEEENGPLFAGTSSPVPGGVPWQGECGRDVRPRLTARPGSVVQSPEAGAAQCSWKPG